MCIGKGNENVSIPVWCDWESEMFTNQLVLFEVSIPVWCDWELLFPMIRRHTSRFQFQYGAIGSLTSGYINHGDLVSIPVWCDWEKIEISASAIMDKFQFQYGAIGSYAAVCLNFLSYWFQFQYGAIGS